MSAKRSALQMAIAVAADRAAQFIIPITLVRLLDIDQFGTYRLFWLAVNTVMVFAPLGLPTSLMYFVPRSEKSIAHRYIFQTIIALFITGFIGALLVGPWSPVIKSWLHTDSAGTYNLPIFLLLWVVASLTDMLPSAAGQVRWQAHTLVTLAATRSALVIGAAYIGHDFHSIIVALIAYVIIKVLLLGIFVVKEYGCNFPNLEMSRVREQLAYALPFGGGAALFNLRRQSEQWVVAVMFSAASFSVFSIAGAFNLLVTGLRSSISPVILPRMSRAEARGDIEEVVRWNNKGNVSVSFFLLPALAFFFLFSHPIVTLLFTQKYTEAAPILQIYLVGMARLAVETGSFMVVLRQGRFVMKVDLFLISFSVMVSVIGALLFGLPGAAIGSTLSLYVEAGLTFRRVSSLTGIAVTQLQDWWTVLVILGAGVGATVLAKLVIARPNLAGDLATLSLAAAVTGVAYLVLLVALGQKRLVLCMLGRGSLEDILA